MDVTDDVTATLRAEAHHPPCVLESAGFCTEHSSKSRSIGYEEETSPTLRAGVVPAAVAPVSYTHLDVYKRQILEIGELAGLKKAEVETLRSFLSRQNDIYRAAFGKRATPHLRQCVFFGTTNAESGYLRDTTGNRRFWPVKTPGTGIKHSWDPVSYTHLDVYKRQGQD